MAVNPGLGRHIPGDVLAEYAEGLLPDDERARVGLHLIDCPACSQARDDLLELRLLLGRTGAQPVPIPPTVAHRVEAALATEASKLRGTNRGAGASHDHPATATPLRSRRGRRSYGRILLAAAALVVVAIGASAVYSWSSGSGWPLPGLRQAPVAGPPASPTPTADTFHVPAQRESWAFRSVSGTPLLSHARFAEQVRNLVEYGDSPASRPTTKSFQDEGRIGITVSPESCVRDLLHRRHRVRVLDTREALLDGSPVVLALAGNADRVHAYAIRGCPGTRPDIVTSVELPDQPR